MCGWPDSQEILLWINVFGLALPHAGCLQDSEKWLNNEWQNGRRLFQLLGVSGRFYSSNSAFIQLHCVKVSDGADRVFCPNMLIPNIVLLSIPSFCLLLPLDLGLVCRGRDRDREFHCCCSIC